MAILVDGAVPLMRGLSRLLPRKQCRIREIHLKHEINTDNHEV